ncbi:HIT-like domain protein [Acididesulfobacillus acetoxydans]|uniref:HIT hydrolase, diadenosine tetraphosphate hydrolase n=1 Tax=Acididesulfobacillus acetoxydans TaxID=1561005 RepID=A0A8S0WAI7_9FIRM|nr:histidine triad nucleotide-binding protein [Acididesulfobacillus acetoxydans]CAA7603479.1 HIT-like domain protein [Acididesulfobacillus acetoxydans]CEJ06818.1 HIT hydrolase, diadenosine tetraphosphate hydrolase [Acididesulfobacillus acetoxydans]
MSDCLFCKIAQKEIPSKIVYEDAQIMAFADINPVAPVHILLIPKKHLLSVNDIMEEDEALIGRIFAAIKELARKLEIAESGYRVVTNTGTDGGQVVGHLHFHLIGGRALRAGLG